MHAHAVRIIIFGTEIVGASLEIFRVVEAGRRAASPLIVVVVVELLAGDALVLAGRLQLDKRVDDVVLQGVHDEGEEHHDEEDLQLLVAFGPAQGPVADVGDPGEEDEDDEDDELHAEEAAEVEEGLLEPPSPVGWGAIVACLDGFGRLAEGCEGGEAGE